jgi:hypothetical protein
MDSLAIQQRVERMIRECRALGIEPSSRTIAEIMVDDDVTAEQYESFSQEWDIAFAAYEKAAERALAHLSEVSLEWERRKRA